MHTVHKHMKRRLLVFCILLTVVPGGCATPAIMAGNERGGIVSQTNGTSQAAGFSLADSYRHRYGRVAQVIRNGRSL
jgi:hypothetical protein